MNRGKAEGRLTHLRKMFGPVQCINRGQKSAVVNSIAEISPLGWSILRATASVDFAFDTLANTLRFLFVMSVSLANFY
jgi:hypothetical protein